MSVQRCSPSHAQRCIRHLLLIIDFMFFFPLRPSVQMVSRFMKSLQDSKDFPVFLLPSTLRVFCIYGQGIFFHTFNFSVCYTLFLIGFFSVVFYFILITCLSHAKSGLDSAMLIYAFLHLFTLKHIYTNLYCIWFKRLRYHQKQ